jgi:hypothetical protein
MKLAKSLWSRVICARRSLRSRRSLRWSSLKLDTLEPHDLRKALSDSRRLFSKRTMPESLSSATRSDCICASALGLSHGGAAHPASMLRRYF